MNEIQDIRVCTRIGAEFTLRVREKNREPNEDGVEGIRYALLHPVSLIEIGDIWAELPVLVVG